MSRTRFLRAAVVLAAVLSTVAVAPAAHADVPGRVVVAEDRVIEPGYNGVHYAECPSGSLTGGGYFHGSTTGLPNGGNFPTRDWGPIWWTSFANYDPWAHPITVYGVCTALPSYLTGMVVQSIPAYGQGSATVSCPAGTSATSGGITPGGDIVLDTSRPNGTGWYVHVLNTEPVARNIYVRAMCTSVTRTVVTSSFTVGAGSGWDTVATCPAGRMTLGGGWSFAPTAGVVIDITRPSTFSQGWHVHALNMTGVSRTVTAYSVCA